MRRAAESRKWRSWIEVYEEIREKGDLEELLEELKESFVREEAAEDVKRVRAWIREFRSAVEAVERAMGLKGAIYPKEFGSFIRDPELHLRKKLFIYSHDLARGRLTPEEFYAKAHSAVKTSLLTNSRSLYQSWVYATLLLHLAERGFRLIYPDDLYLHFERSGRQRAGMIPPNAVLSDGFRAVSLFIEAPRPVGWEDTSDLSRVWKLYIALRPDMLAYGGRVLNIVTQDGESPIMRPDVVIECKELEDWYKRARELKGPIIRPLTAEEWRRRWIEGLWDGLADVLDIKRGEVERKFKERRGLRLRDPQIVLLYKKFYEPRRMILVSRAKVPGDVRELLEGEGVEVVDDVNFSREKLVAVADALEEAAGLEKVRADFVELTPRARIILQELLREAKAHGLDGSPPRLVELALELLASQLARGALASESH